MAIKIAVTGHRPRSIGGYNATKNFRKIREHMRNFLSNLLDKDITLISGGALGVDQFWIQVGLDLNLPIIVALPFKGYDARWPIKNRNEYEQLLARCQNVRYICSEGYATWKMQKRNEWMVNNCDLLIAYWNGSDGGTANCVKYARKIGREVEWFKI